MPSHPRSPRQHLQRRGRRLFPFALPLEERSLLSLPGITGITIDTAGDTFVSYDSGNSYAGQQQSVAEFDPDGFLIDGSVFGTTGASAIPGALLRSPHQTRCRSISRRDPRASAQRPALHLQPGWRERVPVRRSG